MFPLLHFLSFLGGTVAFVFVTLSLASGLLWLSELIEEHSRLAKEIGERFSYVIIVLHIILYFSDSLPLDYTAFSIACQIIYMQNFTPNWPFISLSSITFILSCIMVIVNHFLWFFYFSRITNEAKHATRRPYGNHPRVPGFGDIATFFGIFIWLVPIFLFLSLSANDNALPVNSGFSGVPTTPTDPTKPMTPISTHSRGSLFRSLYGALPRVRPRASRRDSSEGLIAPRSPNMIPRAASPSPLRRPNNLQRVPSMNTLPPPMLSPGRRVASEGSTSEPTSDAFSNEAELDPSVRLTPFRLESPKPARRASGFTVSGRPTVEGRLDMRRAGSSHDSTA